MQTFQLYEIISSGLPLELIWYQKKSRARLEPSFRSQDHQDRTLHQRSFLLGLLMSVEKLENLSCFLRQAASDLQARKLRPLRQSWAPTSQPTGLLCLTRSSCRSVGLHFFFVHLARSCHQARCVTGDLRACPQRRPWENSCLTFCYHEDSLVLVHLAL